MERQCDFAEVIIEHLKKQQFLTFQKFHRTTVPVVVNKNGIYFFGQLIYQISRSWNGQGILINAQAEGLWMYWNVDGRLHSKGHHINGKEEGPWIYWHADGQILSKVVYHDGKRVISQG